MKLNLKTSDKITFFFTFFNFISLIVLLIWINIIYFFAWYSDQKQESVYDININYEMFLSSKTDDNIMAFKEYLLQKDTLIIPKDGSELICSEWVETKIHNDVELIKDKWFYKNDWKIFFIFSQYYEEIGEVKIFFDTTPYVKSQILIIKISLIIIIFSLFIYFIIWRKISKYAFKDLEYISSKVKNINIDKKVETLDLLDNKDDEINILVKAINKSFCRINEQTTNLKQFITDVSHEFKTPLMVIDSQIDLHNKKIEKWKLWKNDTEKLLNNIKEKTSKLNKLLEALFLLSRIENNIVQFSKKEVFLNNTLIKLWANYDYWINKNIKIKYKCKKSTKIKIEEYTFQILLDNLLWNAIKFSGNDSEIEVWCDYHSFWIKDYWVWIKKDKLENIWDKFYKEDINKEWFWVWLFLVKRLVDLYWWKIKVESVVWKGTKFTVIF